MGRCGATARRSHEDRARGAAARCLPKPIRRGQDAAMRLALFQPDIAQNAGAMLRLAACLDVPVDLIEPLGFIFGDARLRRAGMDYLDHVAVARHASWEAFRPQVPGRLILLTTQADIRYDDAAYAATDTLMVGRESAG